MDSKNKDENRLKHKNVDAFEVDSLSKGSNRFTERTCAKPDYTTWRRIKPNSDNEVSPNTTQPDGDDVWDLMGYWSAHAFLKFTAGTNPTADVSLWFETPAGWVFVEKFTNVADLVEIHFDGKIRNRKVYFQIDNITNAPSAIDLYVSPE